MRSSDDNKVNIAAFLYARSDSKRLPRKVFLPLRDKPLIEVMLSRADLCMVDKVVLLTSDRKVDDGLADYVEKLGYDVIRGDSTNLIERTLKAIHIVKPKMFFRINADSPFLEPSLLNYVIEKNITNNIVTNILKRTFPYGVALELINSKYYEDLAAKAAEFEKENVTQHIYRLNEAKSITSVEQLNDHSYLNLTVDEKKDYEYIYNLWGKDDLKSYYEVFDLDKPNIIIKK